MTAPSASSVRDVPRTSSTYFSPSAERGRMRIVESSGSGVADESSLSVSWAPRAAPVLRADRLDLRDLTDAEAALANLVSDDEPGGVRRVDLELERRHERQPLVGAVGEQHRDDDDEHRQRSDDERARRARSAAAASHGPSR